MPKLGGNGRPRGGEGIIEPVADAGRTSERGMSSGQVHVGEGERRRARTKIVWMYVRESREGA